MSGKVVAMSMQGFKQRGERVSKQIQTIDKTEYQINRQKAKAQENNDTSNGLVKQNNADNTSQCVV